MTWWRQTSADGYRLCQARLERRSNYQGVSHWSYSATSIAHIPVPVPISSLVQINIEKLHFRCLSIQRTFVEDEIQWVLLAIHRPSSVKTRGDVDPSYANLSTQFLFFLFLIVLRWFVLIPFLFCLCRLVKKVLI